MTSIAEQTPIYVQVHRDFPDVWHRFWESYDGLNDLFEPRLNPKYIPLFNRLWEQKERQELDRLKAKYGD